MLVQAIRFMGGWAGLLALNTKCPCCGQTLCPVGIVGAGFLAGMLTLLISLPKWIRRRRPKRLVFSPTIPPDVCAENHIDGTLPGELLKG